MHRSVETQRAALLQLCLRNGVVSRRGRCSVDGEGGRMISLIIIVVEGRYQIQ